MHDFAIESLRDASVGGLRPFENNRYGQTLSPLLAQLWRTRMTSLYQLWRVDERPERIEQDVVPRSIYTD
eukprot:152700-Amphidinium_carterae.1